MISFGVTSPTSLRTSIFLASGADLAIGIALAASAAALKFPSAAALNALIARSRTAAAWPSVPLSAPVIRSLAYVATIRALDLIPLAAFLLATFFSLGVAALSTASAAACMI